MKNWIASSKKLNYTVENKAGNITRLSCCFLVLALLVLGAAMPLRAQVDTTSRAARQFLKDNRKPAADTLRKADSLQAAIDTLPKGIVIRDSIHTARPKDTLILTTKREHDPRKAAFYSAVLPGMGQIYNRDYWKLPLVYGALGVSTGVFIWNMDNYRTFRDAYRVRMANATNPNFSDEWTQKGYDAADLKYLRDAYRQYVDYSVIVFILAYGLNIVDATVFAHLKQFDMSDDLSMRISPKVFDTKAVGVALTFQLGKTNRKKFQKSLFALSR